jgi:hypothetical protein
MDSRIKPPTPTAQEKQAALEAVLQSESFARAEQLRAFLRYVCDMEREGRASEIGEYWIGVHALGRPTDFSPMEDSSVRTRAHELRRRLHTYYARENPDAKLKISLPKGSYVPRYIVGGDAGPETETDLDAESSPGSPATGVELAHARRGWVTGFLAGVLISAILGGAVAYWVSRSSIDPAIRRSWAPVIQSDDDVLVAVGTLLYLQVTPYLKFTAIGTPSYPAPPEAYELFSRFRPLPDGAELRMMPVQKAVNLGNVEAISKLLTVLGRFGTNYQILSETNAPLKALRGRNAFLLGSPWYSRSATTLLEQTPWGIQLDAQSGQVALVGRGALAGKKLLPAFDKKRNYREVYGLLSVLANDEEPHGNHTIVVCSGLTSAGLHGAAAFFASPSSMKMLEDRFRAEGLRGWPRAYQVVVRCRATEDTQLLSFRYESDAVIAK